MNKKKTVVRLAASWIVFFLLMVIFARGIGTLDFEKKQYDIADCLVEMYAVEETKPGEVYEPHGEESYMLFDFSKVTDQDVYGISLTLNEKVKLGNFRAYFSETTENFSEENAQKIYREKEAAVTRSSNGAKYLKMCFDNPLDIKSFEVIEKTGMEKIYLCCFLMAFVLGIIYCISYESLTKYKKERHGDLKQILKSLADKRMAITGAVLLAEYLVLCVIEIICYLCISGVHLNHYRVIILSCFATAVTVILRHRESVIRHFHIYYFCFVMMIGTINIICSPCSLDLSWDDQIHYSRANYIARGFQSYDTEAGYQLSAHSLEMGSGRKDNFTEDRRKELIDYIDSIDSDVSYDGLRRVTYYGLGKTGISYVPTAIGLVIARGVGLSTIATLLFGKWVNLLCYSLLFSYSIYLLRNRGYIIAALIGLIPTNVYLASNYSYDWWVTSLTILAYAIFAHELMEHEEVRLSVMIETMVIMFLALLPKPVYVPIILPMLLVRGKKNKKGNKFLLIAAGIVLLLLVLTFMIPVLKGTPMNDTRGSMEVNSAEQISFILSNPLSYAIILIRFLWNFFSPDNCDIMFGFMTSYGEGSLYSIVLILLTIGAVIDSTSWESSLNKQIIKTRMWNVIGILGALVLISTAFYVTYTAVMSDTIDGVQHRYALPLLFPLLYYVCRVNMNAPEKVKQNVLISGCVVMAAVFCYNIYTSCVYLY